MRDHSVVFWAAVLVLAAVDPGPNGCEATLAEAKRALAKGDADEVSRLAETALGSEACAARAQESCIPKYNEKKGSIKSRWPDGIRSR